MYFIVLECLCFIVKKQDKDEVHNNKAVQGRDLQDKNKSKILCTLNIP